MWRLVFALTLVGVTLVTALPAAQNDGSLSDLIDQVLNAKTTPQSVPQRDGNVDLLIKDVFGTGNINTTTSRNLILGTENQTPSKPDDCECVPYYQCKEGKIVQGGIGIIDIRSDFDDKMKNEKPG